MHPLTIMNFLIASILLFVGSAFWISGTPVPFFSSDEAVEEIEFEFTGNDGNLTFIETESPSNLGWAVYSYGDYADENFDDYWDKCGEVKISLYSLDLENQSAEYTDSNQSAEDTDSNQSAEEDLEYFYYPQCEKGSERYDVENMIYIGQLCFNPSNESSPKCSDGNYSFQSSEMVRLSSEEEQIKPSGGIISWLISGLENGRTLVCGSFALYLVAFLLSIALKEEEQIDFVQSSDGPKAEWRAYALSQTERAADGLPKAFSRHKVKRELFGKPRKGNVRGGVHKTGGLFLDGWTSEDSDAEYKKKVKDRRER